MEVAGERALTLPAFRLFLTARAISWAGNAITLVALPLLMFQITGSPASTALLTALEALPYLIVGLPAGALADRWDRKRVMVLTGIASGLAMSTVPVATAMGVLDVTHLCIVAIAIATLFVFFDAAGFGALPDIVGRKRIASATGNMVAVSTVIGLFGPAFGGALAASIGPARALAIDAIAYLVAALLTAIVVWRAPVRDGELGPLTIGALLRDIGGGLRYIWQTRIVRWLTIIGTGASISGGAMLGLTIVAGVQQLGLAADDPRLGLLYSATALGAFLMSLIVAWVQRRFATGWITIVALFVSWSMQIAWALTTSIILGLVVLAVFQAASTLSIMNGIIVRQSLAPDHLQSRVNTTARMIAWGGTPLGGVIGGAIAEEASVSAALIICSAGTGAGLVLALAVRLWRVPRLAVIRAEGDS